MNNTVSLIPITVSAPAKPHRKAVRVFFHDYEKARRDAARNGNKPLLRFHSGAATVLLETGQQVRKDAKIRGKAAKKAKKRQLNRIRYAMPADDTFAKNDFENDPVGRTSRGEA